MLRLQVQQPVLCNVPGSLQAVPGLYLGHTQTAEGQKQFWVLLNGELSCYTPGLRLVGVVQGLC
jgi:hypothetical protein